MMHRGCSGKSFSFLKPKGIDHHVTISTYQSHNYPKSKVDNQEKVKCEGLNGNQFYKFTNIINMTRVP